MRRQTRRAFIATAGAVGFAGCSTFASSNDSNGDPTKNGSTAPGTTPSTTDGSTTTTTPSDSESQMIGKQLEGFENFDRWYPLNDQGKLSAAKKDAYTGSQSAHVQTQKGDKFAGIYSAFTNPIDLSNKSISLAVKLKKPEIAKISVALLAPDRGNMVRMMRTRTGPTDRWLRIDFGATTVKGSPDLSKVQEIRIVGRRRDGKTTPVEFEVDDLRAVERPKKGAVMLTFDDSHITHYEEAFKRMQKYDFPGVEGVIAASVYGNNRLDVGMMREMRDAGWDMASHPLTRGTQLPEFSAKEQKKRIENNKEFLVKKGFPKGARHFLTPQNMRGPHTQDIVEEHHETMFSFGGMPNGLQSTTSYNYGRVNSGNLDGVKQLVDHAEQFKELTVINHHAIDEKGTPPEQFEKQLEYIDQADVEVVTASDLLERGSGSK